MDFHSPTTAETGSHSCGNYPDTGGSPPSPEGGLFSRKTGDFVQSLYSTSELKCWDFHSLTVRATIGKGRSRATIDDDIEFAASSWLIR